VTNPRLLFLDGNALSVVHVHLENNEMALIEPTTGLDSHTSASVMRSIKQLTGVRHRNNNNNNNNGNEIKRGDSDSSIEQLIGGVTVICSIHQPSDEVFALFDHLVLMAKGHIGNTISVLD
jgi:hypothetical protein